MGGGFKTSLSFCFSPGIITEFWFALLPRAWRLVSISIGRFRYCRETAWRSVTWKPITALVCIWFKSCSKQHRSRLCDHCTQICSFSDLRCSLLRPNHEVRAGTDLCRPYACFSPASQSDTISNKTLVSRLPSLLDLLHRPWSYLQGPMCIQFVCACTCLLMSKTWEIIILLPLLPRQHQYKYRSWDKKLLQSVTVKHLDSQVPVRDTS